MVRHEADRVVIEGAVSSATAAMLLEQLSAASRDGTQQIDFAEVTRCDSAAIALMLELRRQSVGKNQELRFLNLPDSLIKLAALYSVSEMISPDAAPSS